MMEGQQTKPLEILVIDDDEQVLELTARMVGRFGANVSTARDGIGALAMYFNMLDKSTPYDGIITDLKMTRKDQVKADGALVTRTIKQTSPNTPVIVITGYEANEDYARLSQELGALKPDGIIQKPFTPLDIKCVVDYFRNIVDRRKIDSNYQSEPLIISR